MKPSARDRFLSKVSPEPNTGCWLWAAGQGVRGYGCFYLPGRDHTPAHRAAWMLLRGPIPSGSLVCHRCDTPGCVNPDHLFLGTARENIDDMMRKGRSIKGERHWRARLCVADVMRIRDLRAGGWIYQAIADEFEVSYGTVRHILRGETWRHVPPNGQLGMAAVLR